MHNRILKNMGRKNFTLFPFQLLPPNCPCTSIIVLKGTNEQGICFSFTDPRFCLAEKIKEKTCAEQGKIIIMKLLPMKGRRMEGKYKWKQKKMINFLFKKPEMHNLSEF